MDNPRTGKVFIDAAAISKGHPGPRPGDILIRLLEPITLLSFNRDRYSSPNPFFFLPFFFFLPPPPLPG